MTRYNPSRESLPGDFPDDPVLLKQLLLEALNRQEESAQASQTH